MSEKMKMRMLRGCFLALGLTVSGVVLSFSPAHSETIDIGSFEQLDQYFVSKKYEVRKWIVGSQNVPAIVILDIPDSWRKTVAPSLTVENKKKVFFRVAIPLAFVGNSLILKDREKLARLKSAYKAGSLDAQERDWLRKKAADYKISSNEIGEAFFTELGNRMDIVPASLMVAQMADESGWGTSRFAAEGNALFGQWSYTGGIKPKDQRKDKGNYSIKAFKTPLASIQAYMLNLNSNAAYGEFRKQRASFRLKGMMPTGPGLVGTLINYSERREAYVRDLRNMMARNDLPPLDKASLRVGETVYIRLAEGNR
ncbi:glucosaminidase domain-containing protein [Sneathiella marina]|uniref:Glucosaminidase domain-containing protein n=1 Tax=Sneathiella marina TaxID=2950108 RepID=A0ABY4W859_9PROT|nr:glucosaminidase domain-containing protein [Sneathiella marina]USG63031.1 glucosaminidase domain-containing protein [Sneathiella marina]